MTAVGPAAAVKPREGGGLGGGVEKQSQAVVHLIAVCKNAIDAAGAEVGEILAVRAGECRRVKGAADYHSSVVRCLLVAYLW